MKPAQVRQMFERFAAATPEPRSDLVYANPFQLLVAVILSAQATDKSVNLATPALFAAAPTPEKLAALGAAGIVPYIQRIGLFRTKAQNLAAMAQLLVERHQSAVPNDRVALEALPGVGRKTANVVLNIAFHEPTIAVDTHIFRVANRTGLAPGKTVDAVEKGLLRAVPAAFRLHAHHWLILHGRYTCMARSPRCSACLIADLCNYNRSHHV
jgi:endonuclease-3